MSGLSLERKEQINENVIKELPLERKEEIVDFSNSFDGFNKDVLDFLCNGSSGCLYDYIDFEEALDLLSQGYNVEHVKLWYELKNHVGRPERINLINSQKDFFEVVTSGVDLSFLLNDSYNSSHVEAFLSAYKKHLPNEKIDLLKNAKIHSRVINYLVNNPDKIEQSIIRKVIKFNDSFDSISRLRLDYVISGILDYGFSDEQISALINEEYNLVLLFRLFEAGMPAKYADAIVFLKNVPSSIVINALKEKVNFEEIIEAAKHGDEGKITLLTSTAKKRRIDKEFRKLVKKYYS